jgi:hypothetical protein
VWGGGDHVKDCRADDDDDDDDDDDNDNQNYKFQTLCPRWATLSPTAASGELAIVSMVVGCSIDLVVLMVRPRLVVSWTVFCRRVSSKN